LTFTVGSGSAAACTTQGQTTTCAVNILFGGHLAKGTADASGWGTGRGASSFPGASISMRMHSVDGNSSGAVNRSIQSAAVLAPAQGHIIVDKVTSPSGDPTSFSFSTTGTGYASFSLTDAATPNGQTLSPGAYSVSEAIPAGCALTGLSCVSSLGTSTFATTAPPVAGPGTATASITLAANDTVTCTFTDTKQVGHIIIAKRTIPPGATTPFAFTTTGPGGYTNTFTLTDGGSNDQTLAPGSYAVSETVPMALIAPPSCPGPATSSFPTAAPP